MPRKRSEAARVMDYFATQPLDAALEVFELVKDAIKRRQQREGNPQPRAPKKKKQKPEEDTGPAFFRQELEN